MTMEPLSISGGNRPIRPIFSSHSKHVKSLACVFDAHGDCRLPGCSCLCHRNEFPQKA